MSKRLMIIAPHPDDEILGVGGTLLRAKAAGYEVAWLIVTGISTEDGWSESQVNVREGEIAAVANLIAFDKVFRLDYPAAKLDQIPLGDLVAKVGTAVKDFKPTDVYVPFYGDAHSDHQIVYQASVSAVKWFRYPEVERVFCYETLSETDAGLTPDSNFCPNWFVDITPFMAQKLNAIKSYSSEVAEFPFPRSVRAIEALAAVRGTASGFQAAEAFQLLRSRESLS